MERFEEPKRGLSLGLVGVLLVLCLIGAMGFALWLDITVARLFTTLFYFLIVGPLTVAVVALVLKLLASAVFGWHIRYIWLVVVTGFGFLALQVLGQAHHLVYTSLWRFSGLIGLVSSLANILLFSVVVGSVISLGSGRSWRQSFLLTFMGALGLSFLLLAITRYMGFRAPGFWPLTGIW